MNHEPNSAPSPLGHEAAEDQARRDFLKRAGRFAVLTPPTVTMLLSTSMNSNAVAASGGGRGRIPDGQVRSGPPDTSGRSGVPDGQVRSGPPDRG